MILDEFQRFKGLLENRPGYRDPAAELFQTLVRAKTPEGQPVRTLLLSATPYKLYTTDAEIEHEDHYEDFLATTRFLLNEDEQRVETLRSDLSAYGAALKRAVSGHTDQVPVAKSRVEHTLRQVMARTERVAASADRDAMIEEPRRALKLSVAEVQQYLAADALFRAVGDQDPMVFWKSASYLLHFMHGYKFNERLDETVELSPEKVARVLREHGSAFLDLEALKRWQALEPAHAKLDQIARDLIDVGFWKLLWIPPTVPYWSLEGPYEGQQGITKTLLFSAWNLVPDVVSGWLSYEAERRMVSGTLESYLDPAKQQAPLLRLTQIEPGKRARHRLLLLLLPCIALSDRAHPLSAPEGMDRRVWVKTKVTELLADPRLPNPSDGPIDERWEWALPLLLDPGLKDFLRLWRARESIPRPNRDVFVAYIDDLLALNPSELGRRPPGLSELAAEVALGAPAVLAARTLLTHLCQFQAEFPGKWADFPVPKNSYYPIINKIQIFRS
ncbi:MAG: hypothetical protein U9Q81_06890 [Pseudomonadota bacterium]|nr:hypothetical protein [Pseudomonadota bacterium]